VADYDEVLDRIRELYLALPETSERLFESAYVEVAPPKLVEEARRRAEA